MGNRRKAVTESYIARKVYLNKKVKQTHLTAEGVRVVVEGVFEELANALVDRGYVNITNLGWFDIQKKKAMRRVSAIGSFGNGMLIEKPVRGKAKFVLNEVHQQKIDEKIQKNSTDG